VAWHLIRNDRALATLCFVSAICTGVGLALVLYAGGAFTPGEFSRGRMALVALIALYPLTLVSVFLNVAIATAAAAALDGKRLDLGDALGAARDRFPQIALLSLFLAGVGFLLSELAARLPGGGKLAAWLLGAAWGLATIFAVPLMALEGADATAALQGSARLIKSRWGEGIVGTLAIGVLPALIAVPGGLLLAAGFLARESEPALSGALFVLGISALGLVSGFSLGARGVFGVALYRHATGLPATAFPTTDLEFPFEPRNRRMRQRWRAYLVWLLVFLVLLPILIVALRGS
jgi:hypothetical protein